MSRKKKVLISLGLCLVLALSIGYVNRPVVLRLGIFTGSSWGVPSTETYEYIDKIIERFEKKYPNVQVTYDSGIRRTDYSSWMADQILSGECPDVFLVPDTDFYSYVELGVLKNLNSCLSSDETFDSVLFYSGTLEQGRYHFEQFALPFEYNPKLMLVNQSLLSREGISIPEEDWSVDEFISICRQVTKDTDHNGTIDQFGVLGYDWEDILNAYNIQLEKEDGELELNKPMVRQALQKLIDLEKLCVQNAPAQNDLDEGRVAFAPMSYAEFITYNPYPWRIKRYSSFDWMCIPMPSQSGIPAHYEGSAVLMGISSRTFHTGPAWNLLKEFCLEKESQKEIITKGLGISPLAINETDKKILSYYDELGISLSSIDQIMEQETQIHTTLDESVKDQISSTIQRIVENNEDLDIALMELEQKLNENRH